MTTEQLNKVNKILDEIGLAMDLTEAQYKLVEDRYKAVANHLAKDTSLLKAYEPDVMPQGSFLIGTMIKPIMEDDELDVDIVCRLKGKNDSWAQYHLKQAVKKQIEEDARYKDMLNKKEGRRCWRIDYDEDTKFHLDVLPAIVGSDHFTLLEKSYNNLNIDDINHLAIRITDKNLENYTTETNTANWLKSNPFGYAAWFAERKKTSLRKAVLLMESIKPLPKFEANKEPLQRVVQILKRHRDIMFGCDEDRPISIIITTLAAKAYNQEINIVDALLNIVATMKNHITYEFSPKYNRNIAWVRNPVNAEENYADKWPDAPDKEDNFMMWLDKVQTDFEVLRAGDITQIYRILKSIIGSKAVNEGYTKAGAVSFINESYLPVTFDKSLFTISHRAQPTWPIKLNYNVEVHGNYRQGKKQKTISSTTSIPKQCDIFFVATTNAPKPFDVYWQVVNTGAEAASVGGLRGGIMQSKTFGVGGLNQKEYSSYKGTHWVECFIVKNGVCVGRSYEFLVNID